MQISKRKQAIYFPYLKNSYPSALSSGQRRSINILWSPALKDSECGKRHTLHVCSHYWHPGCHQLLHSSVLYVKEPSPQHQLALLITDHPCFQSIYWCHTHIGCQRGYARKRTDILSMNDATLLFLPRDPLLILSTGGGVWRTGMQSTLKEIPLGECSNYGQDRSRQGMV